MFSLRGMSRPRRRVVTTGLVAVLALGACGGGESKVAVERRVKLVAATADKTFAATTSRMTMSISFEGDAAEEGGAITMDGAADLRNGNAVFEMSGDLLGVLGGKAAEIRIVDGVMYMGAGGLAAADPSLKGKEWTKFDMKALAEKLGADVTSKAASGFDRPDPAGTLAMLRGVSDDVDEVGREKVRGVDTTHYRIEIDPKKALEEVDGLPAEPREAAREALEKLGDAKVPADVWIDGEGRLRKMSMTLDSDKLGVARSDSGARATVTYELYGFGAPVEVTAPPPEKVIDIGEMFAGLAGAFTKAVGGLGDATREASR